MRMGGGCHKEGFVEFRFKADEWEGLTPAARVRRCRLLAGEAQTLANHTTAPNPIFAFRTSCVSSCAVLGQLCL